MKILRALLAISLALLQLGAFSLPVQTGEIVLTLDCDSRPQTLTLSWRQDSSASDPLVLVGVTSSDAAHDPERVFNEVVTGNSQTFSIPGEPIFQDGADEGAVVYTNRGHIVARCESAGSRRFAAAQNFTTSTQIGSGASLTLTLTLRGETDAIHTFGVAYTATEPDGNVVDVATVYCGPAQLRQTFPHVTECAAGETYRQEVEFDRGTVVEYDIVREQLDPGLEPVEEERFGGRTTTLDGDVVGGVYYDFVTSQGGVVPDQLANIEAGMRDEPEPRTNGRPGRALLAGGVAAILMLFLACGYALRRRSTPR